MFRIMIMSSLKVCNCYTVYKYALNAAFACRNIYINTLTQCIRAMLISMTILCNQPFLRLSEVHIPWVNLYKTQKVCGNPQKEKGQKPNMGICPSSRRYMNYGKSMISLLHYLFYGYRTCCQPKIPSFYENNIYGTSYNLEDRIFSFLKWCRQKTHREIAKNVKKKKPFTKR